MICKYDDKVVRILVYKPFYSLECNELKILSLNTVLLVVHVRQRNVIQTTCEGVIWLLHTLKHYDAQVEAALLLPELVQLPSCRLHIDTNICNVVAS